MQNGLRQQEMVDRLSAFYGDVSSYRRIENGARVPERDAAIAILVHGLKIGDVTRINTALALAGYAALTMGEATDVGIVAADQIIEPPEKKPEPTQPFQRPPATLLISSVGACAAIAISAGFCANCEFGLWLGLAMSTAYAGLYLISLLLETAYEPQVRRSAILAGLFSLMLLSSSAALAADTSLTNSGTGYGLGVAMAIFLSAGALQTLLSRRTLPDSPLVKGMYLMHTAQSAHLKNTCYFLLLAVLFWVPPVHTVTVLRREMQLGHVAVVRQAIRQWMLIGHGMISLSYGWLVALLIVLVIISLPMRSKLLDNLKPHPNQNSYLHLFYIRALVYFALSGTCVIWYAYAVGSLLDEAG